jgi:hypothetical protein
MKLIDRDLFETKMQELLDKFTSVSDDQISTEENSQEAADLDKEVFDLIVELFAILKGLDPENLQIRQELEPYVREKLATFDPDNPEETRAAKMIRLLAYSQEGAMSKYTDALQKLKDSEFSEVQVNRALGFRSNTFNDFLLELLRENPRATTSEALSHIRNSINIHPISDIDEEWIYVLDGQKSKSRKLPKIKQYSIDGLGIRLSRLRKILKEES